MSPMTYVVAGLAGAALLVAAALGNNVSLSGVLLTPAAALDIAAGWSAGYLREAFATMKSACGN